MVQTALEAFQAELQAELSVLRQSQQWSAFRALQELALDWLSQHRFSRASLVDQLELKAEQLESMLGKEPGPRGVQTRTWCKLAVSLIYRHQRLVAKCEAHPDWLNNVPMVLKWFAETAPVVPEVERRRIVDRLGKLASDSRRSERYRPEVLSATEFSDGLQESLMRFNEEIRYLTVCQLEALESHQRSRRLWVQGPAGSGKTLFAVEAAYRSLRAGHKTLLVYRSTQFKYVFEDLLAGVSDELYLLPHIDFMYLVRMIELHGTDSKPFEQIVEHHFPSLAGTASPVWDLVIVDDCGTFETHLPWRLVEIEELAHRTLMLAAPDQIVSHILFDLGDEVPEAEQDPSLGSLGALGQAVGVLNQPLEAPDHFDVVTLGENVRNAQSIVAYIQSQTQVKSQAVVRESGELKASETTWSRLQDDLVALVEEGLLAYPPNRIRVIVDPHLRHPDISSVTPVVQQSDRGRVIAQSPPVVAAVLTASIGGSFLHTTMEADDELRKTLTEIRESPIFISTDGESVFVVDETHLKRSRETGILEERLAPWGLGRVDALGLLRSDALNDPFEASMAILIYQAPLMIGLEADMVIYVRNERDLFDTHPAIEEETRQRLRQARREHHFLAMSRAKHRLVDLIIRE